MNAPNSTLYYFPIGAVVNEFVCERGIARRALLYLIHTVKRVIHVFSNEPVAVYDGIEPAVLIVDVGGE